MLDLKVSWSEVIGISDTLDILRFSTGLFIDSSLISRASFLLYFVYFGLSFLKGCLVNSELVFSIHVEILVKVSVLSEAKLLAAGLVIRDTDLETSCRFSSILAVSNDTRGLLKILILDGIA